jgi:hypothetical protein
MKRRGDPGGRRSVRLLAGASVAAAALCTGASAASAPRPATLVAFPGIAHSFDADAGRIAWIDSAWALHIRSLRSGAETKILYTNPYEEIPSLDAAPRLPLGPRLVLGPRRVLWISTRGAGMFYDADHVYVASVDAKRGRRVANVVHGEGVDGGYVTGIAGDADGFAYGIVTVARSTTDETLYGVSGGGVWTLAGMTPHRLPGVAPAYVLAESAGRIAIAPVATDESTEGTPVAEGTIEIRSATTGELVSTVLPPRPFRAATLTPTTLAVLTATQIVRYAVPSGQILGSTAVAADSASALDSGGGGIAFRRARSVGVLDAATGRVSIAVTAAGTWRPSGVAIAGQILAWAESRRVAHGEVSKKTYTTRIRTTALPALHR